MTELSAFRSNTKKLLQDQPGAENGRFKKLSADLQTLENKLSAAERQASEPLENPLPCYFNTGRCYFEDGDVTGIEMSAGRICLVRWPDDEGQPRGRVLQAGHLQEIFRSLQQSGQRGGPGRLYCLTE